MSPDNPARLDIDLDVIIDFRFSEIEYELYSIEQHRISVETQLPELLQREYARLQAEDEEYYADEHESYYRQERIDALEAFIEDELPRLYRYPLLVSLWAAYESATKDIAKDLRGKKGRSLQLDDLRGDALETRIKYFEHVLEFPLVGDPNVKRHLRMLLVVRNAIAHGNGRRDAVNQKVWEQITSWDHDGIATNRDYLLFSAGFIEEMVRVVGDSLRDLIERVKAIG